MLLPLGPVIAQYSGGTLTIPIRSSVGALVLFNTTEYSQVSTSVVRGTDGVSYPVYLGQSTAVSSGVLIPNTVYSMTFNGSYYTINIGGAPIAGIVPTGNVMGLVNYVITGGFSGLPTAGMVLITSPTVLAYTLPAGLVGSAAVAGVAPANPSSLSLLKNGVNVGLINFASGGVTGTFSMVSQTVFSIGDVLVVSAPGVVDPTFANVGFSLIGLLS